jgi:hypothetical protein
LALALLEGDSNALRLGVYVACRALHAIWYLAGILHDVREPVACSMPHVAHGALLPHFRLHLPCCVLHPSQLRYVACRVLCSLRVVRCVLHVACCMLYVASDKRKHATVYMVRVAWCTPQARVGADLRHRRVGPLQHATNALLLALPACLCARPPLPLGVCYPVAYPDRCGAGDADTLLLALAHIHRALERSLPRAEADPHAVRCSLRRVLYDVCCAVRVACEVACRRLPGCMLHVPCCIDSFAC